MSNTTAPETVTSGWPLAGRLIASGLIIFHLTALVGLVFATQTGPWSFPGGSGIAHAPVFAQRLFNATRDYRRLLRLTEDYRFTSNLRPEAAHQVEIRLKDIDGKVIETIKLPDPSALPSAYHRESLIASALAEYRQQEPLAGEQIPPPGQAVKMAKYWLQSDDGSSATLQTVPEHLLPRDRELVTPTDYALIIARSLARHAKEKTGAADAEVVLISKPTFGAVTVMPDYIEQRQAEISQGEFDSVEFLFGSTP